MGILGRIGDSLTASGPEIRFHRVHTAAADGSHERITYVTGEVVNGPTLVACSADLRIPEGTILLEDPDATKGVTINEYTYPLYQYTTASPEDVASEEGSKPVPESLTGTLLDAQELRPEEIEELEAFLP